MRTYTPTQIIQSALLTIFFVCTVQATQIFAQSFTQWEQGESSDYYLNIEWAANTNNTCNCYSGDLIQAYLAGSPNFLLGTLTYAHASPQVQTSSFELGPDRFHNVFGDLTIQGTVNSIQPPIPCILPVCQTSGSSSSIVMSTDLPYPPTILEPTYANDGTITLNWTIETDIPEDKYFTYIYKNGDPIPVAQLAGYQTSWEDPNCSTPGTTYSFRGVYDGETAGVNYVRSSFPPTSYTFPSVLPPVTTRTGSIMGKVTTEGGSGVGGVTVTAVRQSSIPGAPCAPASYSAQTQNNGTYTIPFIYWGETGDVTTFTVTPSLPLHGFAPANQDVFLQAGNDDITMVDFVDTTAFDVEGIVRDANGCGLDSVRIAASPGTNAVFTNALGEYRLTVPVISDLYTITAQYDSLELGEYDIDVVSDTSGYDFVYSRTDTLNGFVGAGCYENIGIFTLNVRSLGGCLIETVQTNASGYFGLSPAIEIPSRRIEIEVVGFDPFFPDVDQAEVLLALDSIYEINLDTTTTLDIFYRKPISIDVTDMPPPPCPAVGVPVLNQDQLYTVSINIWESVGICRADTGYITISDDVSTTGIQDPLIFDSIPFSEGLLQYSFRPGEPALNAPYQKNINITAFVGNQVKFVSIPVIVSGTRIRESTLVLTPSDSIPFLILRDPPGDESTAFFEEDNMTSYAQSFSHEVDGSVKAWVKAKGSIPLFGVNIWGQIEGSLEVGGTRLSSTETEITLETTNRVETSSSSDLIGEDGDLVLGAAVIFKYGLSDDRFFDLNSCSITIDTSLVFSPDTFTADYAHSIKFIKTTLIPNLEFLATNPDTTEEARRKFANSLNMWEQVLQLNQDLKDDALRDAEFLSYDAGSAVTTSISGSSTRRASLEFTTYLDAGIVGSAGVKDQAETFEIEGGIAVKIRNEWGESQTEATTETTTTGYTYSDNDTGTPIDNHVFATAVDPVYGTAVFKLDEGSSTSCPYEEGSSAIDVMKLTIDNPVWVGEPGEGFHEFDFTVQRLSTSAATSGTREYFLDPIESSSNAIVTVNNSSLDRILFNLAPGQLETGKIQVTRPPGDQYAFEGIQFDFYAGCFAGGNPFPELGRNSTAFVSAFFANDCPNIFMPSPTENWIINQTSGDVMTITMNGYDLSGGNIDNVKLMYRNLGDNLGWQPAALVSAGNSIPGGNLLPPPQSYQWDVSDLEDGNYVIRWELTCGATINHSPRVFGKIDRKLPRVFGVEKPVNDLYIPGDEISVQFTEDLDYSILTHGNVFLKTLPEGIIYGAELAGEGNEVIIIADEDLSPLYNQTFQACVYGISDLAGNIRPDTTTWEFVISEPDSDRDGVPDTQDRCPGGNDFADTDMDGLPDDCDCAPLIKANGRVQTKAAIAFDGVNDYIRIPHDPELIPTATNAVTYETWIYPEESSNELGFLSSSGSFPNRNHQIYFYNSTNRIWVTGTGVSAMLSNDTIPHNAWTHIAVVYNLNETKLYINGELDNARFQTLTATDFGSDVTLGQQSSGGPGTWSFQGIMEESRIWDHARTQTEILEHMNAELAGSEPGLLAYYNMNEGIPFGNNTDLTVVKDGSINGRDGTLTSFDKSGTTSNWVNSPMGLLNLAYDMCQTCPDSLNAALDFTNNPPQGFNSAAPSVHIPSNAQNTPTSSNPVTFEVWLYPELLIDFYSFFVTQSNQFGNNFLAGITQDQRIIVNVNSSGSQILSQSTIPLNDWTHIALVMDQDRLDLYINGVLDTSSAFTFASPGGFFGPIELSEGAFYAFNAWEFNGKMDDVRIWNEARTSQQIAENFETEIIESETGLVGYYNFNQGLPNQDNSGITVIEDVSGSGNDASLNYFAQNGTFANWVESEVNFSDSDGDGLPDACDSCFALKDIVIENTQLEGIYRARQKITLGTGLTFPSSGLIEFRAPIVEVLQVVPDVPAAVSILVSPDTCQED